MPDQRQPSTTDAEARALIDDPSFRRRVAELRDGRRCHACQKVIPTAAPGNLRLCPTCIADGQTIEPPSF